MSFEYAPRGFVGILTPQANTTVEPECGILLPAGIGLVNARLASAKPAMEERLVDYFDKLPASLSQFADAPLRAVGVACTGSSYLAGREREDALFQQLSHRLGIHVTSSALAVVDALHALDARRIGLVSPYPESLLQQSIAYWRSRGFAVEAVAKVIATGKDHERSGSAHPVYALGSEAVVEALATLRGKSADAIVLLGTGMPSLKSILQVPIMEGAPVMSCTLALAWRCVRALEGATCSAESLLEWIAAKHWKTRWQERCAAT
ncbi:MAG TPA: aspartate/glutamate racemase family protein [Ramlibacter sp.]|nr:aspartate/glutamate racemase family protein [Ramlibacter sp.]